MTRTATPAPRARKNYAATSPVTRQSGKKKIVLARFIRNGRLADALHRKAQSALRASPGARAYYDQQRDRGLDHNAALRRTSASRRAHHHIAATAAEGVKSLIHIFARNIPLKHACHDS